MEEEFNKHWKLEENHIDILERKSLISQLQASIKSLTNRDKYIGTRVSGMEDKA
jgi:hypothetical protein